MYQKYIKRFLDVFFSFMGILILILPMALVSLIIKMDSCGSVIFKQKRIGKNKKQFNIYKFRSMKSDTPSDIPTHLFNDRESQVTRVGRIIRKTSIDELPQLFNILKGDMSIVGPRPALYNQLDLIEEREKYGANVVSPGLTGLAQINGRDELSIEEKAKFDGKYVEKITFLSDLKIIIKTVMCVFKCKDIK